MRWNRDREDVAQTGSLKHGCYDVKLNHMSNKLYQEVWGEPLDENYHDPKQFSGSYIYMYMKSFVSTNSRLFL